MRIGAWNEVRTKRSAVFAIETRRPRPINAVRAVMRVARPLTRSGLPPTSIALPRPPAPPRAGGFLWTPASYICLVPRIAFLPLAKLRPAPPTGPEWLHEVKFDGFRIQLHKDGRDVRLFSRNGKDFTDRFPSI